MGSARSGKMQVPKGVIHMEETVTMIRLDTALWGAIITALVTIVVHWFEAKRSSEKMIEAIEKKGELADAAFDKAMSVYAAQTDAKIEAVNVKIDDLAKHVEKHNNVIERTYKLEEMTAVQTEQIKVANHRLADLEKAVNKT